MEEEPIKIILLLIFLIDTYLISFKPFNLKYFLNKFIENQKDNVKTKEDFSLVLENSYKKNILSKVESTMINNVLNFNKNNAKSIMIPRVNVFMLNVNLSNQEILKKLITENYSRVPIYQEEIDNIIGILYMKDFLIEVCNKGIENINIRTLIKKPNFVSDNKPINLLFEDIKVSQNHISILIDEYGGFSGIVTIEDLIEEITGNILDEYDELEQTIKQIDDKTYLIDGLVSINDINNTLNINLETSKNTIGGFLVGIFGFLPNTIEKNKIIYENLCFEILEIKNKRISKVVLKII